MTQQPYAPPGYQPQYPQAPQPPNQTYPPQQPPYAQPMPPQGYPQQAPPPQYQQPYAPQPGYPPQGQGQQPPAQPLAPSTLDDFYAQPSTGSGPSIGWTDDASQPRPLGSTWIGVVARDVTNSDVEQSTDIKTGQPQFFRDGSPKRHMKVPLRQVALFDPNGQQQPTPKLPEGEGTWFCKGQARDELVRAMAEAGADGAPKGGAVVRITLVQRRPSGAGMNPANIVQISYQPGDGGQTVQQAQPTPPAPQQAPGQPQATTQVQAPAAAQEQYAAYTQPPQGQYAPQQPPVTSQPAQVLPGVVQAPPNMDPQQQALWDRITQGGQQGPGAPQGQPAV